MVGLAEAVVVVVVVVVFILMAVFEAGEEVVGTVDTAVTLEGLTEEADEPVQETRVG